jgi:undecaprenyl-phosphate 4-deoxy-4-formamido-L-arabinose transferase
MQETSKSTLKALAPGFSVVVPVYRSAAVLPELVARIDPVLKSLGQPFELVLVNDGSPDNSWQVIEKLASAHQWVRGIALMRNFGQHNALLCGIRNARHEIVVTIDDDLQHPPEEIVKLLAKLGEGYDVVYGTPQEEQHGMWRNLASQLTKLSLKSTMGVDVARNVSAFRVFRTELRGAFANYQSPFVSIDVLLTWATTRIAAVQVQHDPRKIGTSNYTVGKLVRYAFNMITSFSVLPLQIASLVGFLFTLFGALVLFYVVGRYLVTGTSVPGFPFLASIIAIFSGAQLFALGIIGEYLARVHFRTMDKPPYAVRARIRTE